MNADRTARRPSISRRRMLHTLSIGGAGVALARQFPAYAMQAGRTAPDGSALLPLNRFPRMVQEFFVARENEIHQQRLRRWQPWRPGPTPRITSRRSRTAIREAFGPLPERRRSTPRVTKVVERDAYKIENVIFESRPGFLVTANLYIPKGRTFPLPGVVGSCGHSDNGKAIEAYQSFCQGLARLGYVVLIFDPIGQGERLQYVDAQPGSPERGTGTREHIYAGNQQFLVGEFFGTWRAWDGIRALDYLLTRKEVDSATSASRQLRRRHDDDVAVRRRAALDHGRAGLLRHRVPPQHGKRARRRHRAVPAAGRWRSASTTTTSWPRWRRSRSSSWPRRRTSSTPAATKRPITG